MKTPAPAVMSCPYNVPAHTDSQINPSTPHSFTYVLQESDCISSQPASLLLNEHMSSKYAVHVAPKGVWSCKMMAIES